ncbi:NAD(+) kinase [Thiospirillum jenense]|uniref:NAD kinase n=1 Tax=Thiospirillum jenense TaxID=1653858 RepID=A0A839HES5_9GAMM|nr:NAD(+) kinase [Thiospirillum jenense]MBB1126974.1 NAD(+) kinase [Thiospirillum jenense]
MKSLPLYTYQTVGIIGKQDDDARVVPMLERLLAHLHSRNVTPVLDLATAQLLDNNTVFACSLPELGRSVELVLVVGGDGTFLHAARELAPYAAPLVGINLGRLGFLADLSPDTLETHLDQLLAGETEEEQRSLLEACCGDDAAMATVQRGRALNDIVIAKWNTVRMIEFETYIDGQFVNTQYADGIIISTPTGSTAYALSGGGPLLHPSLDALLLVSICPHTLSNRPLVVSANCTVDIRLCHDAAQQVRLTCDGQTQVPLIGATNVQIRRSPHRVRLLHPRGYDHYGILRAKLGWGGHTTAHHLC